MEIRNNCFDAMDENERPDEAEEIVPRPPPSPCDSDISVGCENESTEQAPSPMDMTTEMMMEDEEVGGDAHSPSTSLSRDGPSPRSMSPVSAQGSESYSYLSEEEYFRPLKRLAMSDSSPTPQGQEHPVLQPKQQKSPKQLHKSLQNSRHSPDCENRAHQGSCSADNEETDESANGIRLPGRVIVDGGAGEGDDDGGEGEGDLVGRDQKGSGLRSFSILDILSYKPSRRKSSVPVKIVRPWDTREDSSPSSDTATPRQRAPADTPNNNNNNSSSNNNNNSSSTKRISSQNGDKGSALDALFKMTNKTLDNLNKEDKADAVNIFNNRQQTKKKRKSRTAFTNHQIFELEKRFLYQKYLSPADRDELAQNLGLSNAQVITWFQNRRAKLKRDMEELKRDVESSKVIHNKAFLEASANVVAYLKSKDLPKIPIASLPH